MQYCQICQISLLDSFKNSTHKILILVELKNGLSCAFLSDVAGFLKSHFKGPKYFKKVVLTPRRVECGGTEGEIVLAHGRLPSPALQTQSCQLHN